jgi:hypothetical protein
VEAPLSTLANIVVPAMLVGLLFLLYRVSSQRGPADADRSVDYLENGGYEGHQLDTTNPS